MCVDCGCSDAAKNTLTSVKAEKVDGFWRALATRLSDPVPGLGLVSSEAPGHTHPHEHGGAHLHDHPHDHDHSASTSHAPDAARRHGVVDLEKAILEKNDALAARNRAWLAARQVLMLNLVSSPGSGKTTLLERTIRDLSSRVSMSVIEGDQETTNDAERIAAAGARAIQVNTGTGCHLEADMVRRGLEELNPREGSVVMVENVGNLVCPALFDLGEKAKVAILSVTEGEDKPLKYPHMFRAAGLLLLNKVDLLPHLDFDMAKTIAFAHQVNPTVRVIQTSSKSGAGMAEWYDWIETHLASMRA